MHMSTLCSTWNIFFHFFSAWNYFIYFRIYSLFVFKLIFFFYCLFITSILDNKKKLLCLLCFFIIIRVEPPCVKIFEKYVFIFFSDITYETLLQRGFIWNGNKHFYLIWCWLRELSFMHWCSVLVLKVHKLKRPQLACL